MIAIIKYELSVAYMSQVENVTGWIIATDIHDARRQAQSLMQTDLASHLYRIESEPKPGKYPIGNNMIMLVS